MLTSHTTPKRINYKLEINVSDKGKGMTENLSDKFFQPFYATRSSAGVKEPTDVNALADEYLRLSYHGLRAKDKEFNATIKADFDNLIGKINIIPRDIGRVLLNLYNNVFMLVLSEAMLRQAQQDSRIIQLFQLLQRKRIIM